MKNRYSYWKVCSQDNSNKSRVNEIKASYEPLDYTETALNNSKSNFALFNNSKGRGD